MSKFPDLIINDGLVLSRRGKKNPVDTQKPYAWMIEKELSSSGSIEDVAIIFLTNNECPFRCLMCDLWKNTTDERVMAGSIPRQIELALNELPAAMNLKLYNSGSFFDPNAIPVEDYVNIASMVKSFKTVIVESHPKFIGTKCLNFRNLLKTDLHVALGLETVHPDLLDKLNKKMTLKDFSRAVKFLSRNEIQSRAFVLLKPPFLSEEEGILWAEKSIEFAFSEGIECCTVIPVRPGNGAMDELMENGYFAPPRISSLEKVLEYGINLKAGRVFADTWDLKLFSGCDKCIDERTSRIIEMNLSQKIYPSVKCSCK